MLTCDIVVREIEIQSRYCIHFWTKILRNYIYIYSQRPKTVSVDYSHIDLNRFEFPSYWFGFFV